MGFLVLIEDYQLLAILKTFYKHHYIQAESEITLWQVFQTLL